MGERRALIVVDMQNDYLWDLRMPKFSYDTPSLVDAVNGAIRYYASQHYDVFYILEVVPNNFAMKKLVGFSLAGTPGAELFDGLEIVSDQMYEKQLPDAFSAKDFKLKMQRSYYTEAVVCGLDLCGCAGATAKGARANGMKSSLLLPATGCRFPEAKQQKMLQSLEKLGVQLLTEYGGQRPQEMN